MKRILILTTLLILTACAAAPTPSPSPASTATLTPSPTATGTATPTEAPTDTPDPTRPPRPTLAPRKPITFDEHENGLPLGAIARLGRGRFSSVELSPDGQYLGVGSSAGVTVYNALTFEELWFTSTGAGVSLAAISPDSTMIAGAIRNELAVWDIQTGERLHILGELDGSIQTVSWSPDSSRLFAGSFIGDPYVILYGPRDLVPFNTMLVWDIGSGDLIYNLHSPTEEEMIEDLDRQEKRLRLLESEWSHDGRYLVIGASFEGYGAGQDLYPGRWLLWWDMDTGEQAGYRQWETPVTGGGEEFATNRFAIYPGENILAASSNGDLLFLDLETGEPIDMLTGMDEELTITGVSLPLQGNLILSASNEISDSWLTHSDMLRVWNTETGESIRTFARPDLDPEAYYSLIKDFAWSPLGTEVAAAYFDGRVTIWDVTTGEARLSFEEAGSHPTWLPGGERLMTVSKAEIQVWDTETGELRRALKADQYTQDVVWSPDGQTLIAASEYMSLINCCYHKAFVTFWNPETGKPGLTLSSSNEPDMDHIIRRVAFSPDGKRLAASEGPYLSGDVYVWDAATGERQFEEQLIDYQGWDGKTPKVWDVAWAPDQSILAVAGEDFVQLHDGQTGELIKTLKQVGYTLAWSPDSKTLAAWMPEGVVHLVDVDSGETMLELGQTSYTANSIVWAPDGTRIAIGTGKDFHEDDKGGIVYIFDSDTGEQLAVFGSLEKPFGDLQIQNLEYPVTDIVWLNDEIIAISHGASPMRIYFVGFLWGGGTITIWNVHTGEMLGELEGHNGAVQALDLHPDGSILASGSADGTVILWDVAQIMAMIED